MRVKPTLPNILSFNGGYVDTLGFLGLQGLFTAHVTGNFVTIGAALVLGTSGVLAKLLALPMFCVVVLLTRMASYSLEARRRRVLPTMLTVHLILLVLAAILALLHGTFRQGDSGPAITLGMLLVSAMAIQNAVHRVHLTYAPPSTLMTGTTTQLMIDLADLLRGQAPELKIKTIARMRTMTAAVAAFALGAAAAALLFAKVSEWCFLVPPLVAWAATRASNAAVVS